MVDRYTKSVLTIIAAALILIAFQNALRPSSAQNALEIQKVKICDDATHCALLTPKRETNSLGTPFMILTLPVTVEADDSSRHQ